jgi:hypothetical protein
VSETAGYFLSVQNLQAANGKRIYLDYLRLILATVPASATAGEMFVKLDTTGRTGRDAVRRRSTRTTTSPSSVTSAATSGRER